MLTDGRRVSVINAPDGAGKTRVLAEIGRSWAARPGLGRVIGITPSQSARNTLAAGVPECYNAQFLGHLPGERGARGPVPVGPGVLLLLAGDTAQLQAVQNGGGISLLAEPVRFPAGWERDATLRLREGDASVLADYDQHARIRAGSRSR